MANARIVALVAVSISVLSSSVTLLNTALAAHDTAVTMFQGKATIVYVDHALRHGSIDVNDTVTVRWYQPSKATDVNEDPKFGSYQNMELELFKLSSVLGASRTCSVEIFNASPNTREGDMIYLSCNSFTAQAFPINGYGLDMFTVRLDDTTGSAISDDSLPLKLNLTEWTSAQASLWYSKGSEVPLLILGSFTLLTSSYSDSDSTSATAPTSPRDSTPLSPPSEINVVSTSADNVTLSWTLVQGATGYNVYRSNSPDGPFDLINSSVVNGTSYSDIGLSAATTYYYKVAALDEEGVESDHSIMISTKTEEIVIEPVNPSSEPAPQEGTTPLESPIVPSPSTSNPVPADDKFIAASPTPPRTEFTTNTVLLGSIVVPVGATAVVLLWKKGVFRSRTRMETTTTETETSAPSIAEEPLSVATSTVAAAQRKEPDIMREFVGAETKAEQTEVKVMPMLELKCEPEPKETEVVPMLELKSEPEAEPEQTEAKVMPMLELKSEPDTKLKEYFEAVDEMQKAASGELDKGKKYATRVRKQSRRVRKQKARKQSRRVRKQKARKQSRRVRKR